MTAGRGCDNVVEVPEAQPRRNEVGRLPCLDILPPSEWTYTSGPPPSARSTRRRGEPKLMPKGSGVPLEVRMHGRKGSERLLRRRGEMLARDMPQAKANAATAAELVRWLWALGAMCREATE